jgi:hypothetical protein
VGGLRTHTLVAVGAATFVDIGMHLNGNAGATQIIAYVVSGVGFLGAGVIMKNDGNVWGLHRCARDSLFGRTTGLQRKGDGSHPRNEELQSVPKI